MAERIDDGVVQAAGGVVYRQALNATGTPEVLLVHRPRYDDWTLPKGKLDDSESHTEGALRELWEETGFHVNLGPLVAVCSYTDHLGRGKAVQYFAATVASGAFEPNDEVDCQEWLALPAARRKLSYPRDTDVLNAFIVWLDNTNEFTYQEPGTSSPPLSANAE